MKETYIERLTISERKPGERLSDYVYRILFQNIMDLTLEPGSMINDAELAVCLNCSRTPVRESLFQLRDELLVEIFPQAGIYIMPIDFRVITEMQFVRYSVEKQVVKTLCKSILPESVLKLQENLLLQKNAMEQSGTFKRFFELDQDFHAFLYEALHTSYVQGVVKKTFSHVNRLNYFLAMHGLPYMERSYRQHQDILASIISHEFVKANEVLLDHMMEYKNLEIPEGFETYFRNLDEKEDFLL